MVKYYYILAFLANIVSVFSSGQNYEYNTNVFSSNVASSFSNTAYSESESIDNGNTKHSQTFSGSSHHEENSEAFSWSSSSVIKSGSDVDRYQHSGPPNIICGPDEEYNGCVNGGCGRWNCSQQGVICIDLIEGSCIPGCRCKEPLLRTDDGKCVPSEECPSPQCGCNEEYVECKDSVCRPETCYDLGFSLPCQTDLANSKSCNETTCEKGPGCICKEGYVRDDSGSCISVLECPSCGGDPNAKSGCGTFCTTCDNYGQSVACILSCEENSCDCKEGYVYENKTKKCVLPENCPPSIICGPDEEYDGCVNGGCGRWNCSQTEVICIDLIEGACIPGCRCKEPLLRTDDGKCVPSEECPAPQCGCNEEYVECKDSVCRPETCSDLGFSLSCQNALANNNCSETTCEKGPGCICKEGYVRDDSGSCISVTECPASQCTGQNEVYERAVSCPPQICEVIYSLYKCPKMNSTNVTFECRCKPGYLRNKMNECISTEDCRTPPPNIICGPDEEYNGCVNGGCGRWNCSQSGVICIDLIEGACIPGCRCKEPLLRTDDGKCVPSEECPPPQCGCNEEYVECKDSVCRPETCSDLGFTLSCQNALANNNCNETTCEKGPGCICKEGYVRDDSGSCISVTECPSCGDDSNAQAGCGTFCKTCDNYNESVACALVCEYNGCDCKEGYVYDRDLKKCVLPQNCPGKCTGQNTVYECPQSCGNQTCESIDQIYHCPIIIIDQNCTKECRCKKGYYKNKNDDCISKEQCEKCRGPHEFFSCGGACDNVCAELSKRNQSHCDIVNIKCNPMCYCEKGYARDADGTCIPIENCPEQCGVNEEYVQNPVCRPKTCCDLGYPLPCLELNSNTTFNQGPGCICKAGYVRDSNGICISDKECPSCGGDPNAESGCGTFCTTCDNYGQSVACILICKENSCDCKEGFVYNTKTKKCVLPENCPAKKCRKPNEIEGCKNECPARTCETKYKLLYKCPPRPQVCDPDCVCKPGFFRNKAGDCVTKEQCCCGRWNCSQTGMICIDLIEGACIPGCRCKEPLLRTDDGKCVPSEQCPTPQCGSNEEYVKCKDSVCRPDTCSDLGQSLSCQTALANKNYNETTCEKGPGCICKEGYVRDGSGSCISVTECSSCGDDPNAKTGCGTFCTTCDNYGQSVACILICKENSCDCKDGFVYNTKAKKCVLPENCPPKKCNKPNEIEGCKNACNPRTCETKDRLYKCPPRPQVCYPDCVCKPGFFRNRDGDCVTKEQCSASECTGPNEVYERAVNCPPQICASIWSRFNCSETNSKNYTFECRCKPGFFRNKINECISTEDCLKCTGPNEYFSCGGACDNVCADLSRRNQTNCDVVNVKCNPMCYCVKGYARDINGTCIPIEDCPVCPANAEFVQCPEAVCRPTKCSQVGFPIACPAFSRCPSKPGCICSDGYVMDDNGTCIPLNACPSCKGDENAVSGCGANCKRCSGNLKICSKICKPNSCDCKPGFLLDTNINKCVLPEKCTPTCGPNEVYSNCTNRACHRNNCAQLAIPFVCRPIATGYYGSDPSCKGGCECVSGHLRDSNKTCIPEDQCPEAKKQQPDDGEENNDNNKASQLINGNCAFTAKFLYETAKNNPGQSVVASPFSVLFLLAQLVIFTVGKASEQLYAVLNLKNPEQIQGTIPPFLTLFNSEKNIIISLAEKIYGNDSCSFSEKFKQVTKNVFLAEAENVDFSKSEEAAKIINDWVASETNNLIQNLVPADSLNANTRLVLTNAIYFKGNWSKAFKKENTKPKDFYLSNSKTATVQMMNQVNSFKYGVMPGSQSQVIELPYQNENFTFLVLLPPKTENGLNNLLNEQQNCSSIKSIHSKLIMTKLDLSMPSFSTDTTIDLKYILKLLNVTEIFDPQGSGLTGILEKPENIYVSDAIQKAKIIVTETGAQAAASNAVNVATTSMVLVHPVVFNADHNFIYYIMLKGNPIFCGLYAGPQ